MSAFEQIKSELVRRGMESAEADAQSAAYTRMMNDNASLDDDEIDDAVEQIENMD